MGDEKNIASEEETAALFVSGQKKIKAEEEAKKQAAEEEERRLAAEAKARQDEADLAARKKKAEKEQTKLAKKAERKAAKKKNKLPLLIGLGVFAAIFIGFIAITSDGDTESNKVEVDYDALEANAEYKPESVGNNLKISYPDGLYRDVTENKLKDNSVQVVFRPENEGDVVTNVVLTPLRLGDEQRKTVLKKEAVAFTDMADIIAAFEQTSKSMLEETIPGAVITDVKVSEKSYDNPTQYSYSCNFTSEDYKTGAGYSWIWRNGDGEYRVVVLSCADKEENAEKVNKIKDIFINNNTESAFGMIGANPPQVSGEETELLEETNIHLGLHVPQGLFGKSDALGDLSVWADENGAMIIVEPTVTDVDLVDNTSAYNKSEIYQYLKDNVAKNGAMDVLPNVENREIISEREDDGQTVFFGEYKDTIGGNVYWERAYADDWKDMRTGQTYWFRIITSAPYKNMDTYKAICEAMEVRMEDI